MIEWCFNERITIKSDIEPKVAVRVILPSDTKQEVKSKKLRPFICKSEIKWRIAGANEIYTFTIPKNYCYDGASIPRIFWRVIGSKESNEFLIPALVHDYMCENHNVVRNDRNLSSEIFKELLIACKVSKTKANLMYFAVNNFQRLCGWKKEK
jgi:hypothetical protein